MPITNVEKVLVLKLDTDNHETWRYEGTVLERTQDSILLEAFFNRPDRLFHGILLAEGDRFIEKYFSNRWYNIFEIHDRKSDALKGWYCNVTYPAVIEEDNVSYVDLALDLLVYPDGHQLVLDEDEFAELRLDDKDTHQARGALEELQQLLRLPFQLD
jgi:protein associated with RNAse G/E